MTDSQDTAYEKVKTAYRAGLALAKRYEAMGRAEGPSLSSDPRAHAVNETLGLLRNQFPEFAALSLEEQVERQ